ncbi:MAG: hypothetical protein QW815_07990 [Nitrososphaerota archaeon]
MLKNFFVLVHITLVIFFGTLSLESVGAEERHGHKAHHGGVLNVIGKEAGHLEILVQGETLEAWFVGGGQDTGRAVPIKVTEIPLTASLPGQGERTLVLKAAPLKLAGEKVGHCSHVTAQAEWMRDVKAFEARGEVVFKGVRQKLVIKYPEGYDPLHGPAVH